MLKVDFKNLLSKKKKKKIIKIIGQNYFISYTLQNITYIIVMQ